MPDLVQRIANELARALKLDALRQLEGSCYPFCFGSGGGEIIVQRKSRIKTGDRKVNMTLSKSRAPHWPRDCSEATRDRDVSLFKIALK